MRAKFLKSILIASLAVGGALLFAPNTNAGVRFRGGIIVGPAYGPWGWYHPYFYGPSYYGPYGVYPNAGEVKLETKVKDAEVFINGAYAGTTGKLKSMWLRPDKYDLEIRAPGGAQFAERIYVVAGKTLRVRPDFRVEQPQL